MRSRVAKFAEDILKGNFSNYGGIVIGMLHGSIIIYLIIMMINWLPFGLFQDTLQQSIIAEPFINILKG